MSKIFLVRHGQDFDNEAKILNGRRDMGLTELGYEQAKKVAEKLLDNNIEIIYSSPLKRAYETARVISEKLKIDEIITDDLLLERDMGILTGKPISDIPKYSSNILKADRVDYFLDAEGAETFPTLLERGKEMLKKIQQSHPNKNILVVAHGDIGKMIRAAYHGWTWEKVLMTPYFDNTGVLELSDNEDKIE